MLGAEDLSDTTFIHYEPKQLEGMIHPSHLATFQNTTVKSGYQAV